MMSVLKDLLPVRSLVFACLSLWLLFLPIKSTAQALSSAAGESIQLVQLNLDEQQWIADRIYQNECASNEKYLTYWGAGEEFPSFGIGHFIWYVDAKQGAFQQTFPQMISFVARYQTPPQWLLELKPFYAPWQSKQQFDQALQTTQMLELRQWLLDTRNLQGEFIVQQFVERLNKGLSELQLSGKYSTQQLIMIRQLISRMLVFKQGRFALVDYVNFKGIGTVKEQYQGQQWGLISVLELMIRELMNAEDSSGYTQTRLQAMQDRVLLQFFVKSAKQRLALRVQLAPAERNEQSWLKGWFKRLEGYMV